MEIQPAIFVKIRLPFPPADGLLCAVHAEKAIGCVAEALLRYEPSPLLWWNGNSTFGRSAAIVSFVANMKHL